MIKKIQHYIKRIRDGRLQELIDQWLWMLGYVKQYWYLIGSYTLLGASGSFLGLGTSMVSRDLVDTITGQNTMEIAKVVSMYIGVGFSQLFINAIKTRLSLRISMKVNNEIRGDIFEKISKICSDLFGFWKLYMQFFCLFFFFFGMKGRASRKALVVSSALSR